MLISYLAHLQHIFAAINFGYCLYTYLNNKDKKILIILCAYPLLSIITDIMVLYQIIHHIRNLPNSLFTIFEFFLFLFIINKYTDSKKTQIYSILAVILYSAFIAVLIATKSFFENLILLPACCVYVLKLFQRSDITKIDSSFSFCIVLGITFYVLFTTPYFIFVNILPNEYKEKFFIINTIAYVVMNIFFIKGYLCLKIKK
jgi:hypothetical protein